MIIGKIDGEANGSCVVEGISVGTACHIATLFWLIKERHNRAPTIDELNNAGPTISDMVQGHGHEVNEPYIGSFSLPAHSVLVFMDDLRAGHSCIVLANRDHVGGYNQVGWFSSQTADTEQVMLADNIYTQQLANRFSVHSLREIIWDTNLLNRNRVRNANNHAYRLFHVKIADALNFV